jgi:hypothetical protein
VWAARDLELGQKVHDTCLPRWKSCPGVVKGSEFAEIRNQLGGIVEGVGRDEDCCHFASKWAKLKITKSSTKC